MYESFVEIEDEGHWLEGGSLHCKRGGGGAGGGRCARRGGGWTENEAEGETEGLERVP